MRDLDYKIIKHAKGPVEQADGTTQVMSYKQAYRLGLITQMSNPKIAIVLASIFTALLPKEIPSYFYVVLPMLCFFIDAGCFFLFFFSLSAEKTGREEVKFKKVFDRVAGGVKNFLCLKLILGMK